MVVRFSIYHDTVAILVKKAVSAANFWKIVFELFSRLSQGKGAEDSSRHLNFPRLFCTRMFFKRVRVHETQFCSSSIARISTSVRKCYLTCRICPRQFPMALHARARSCQWRRPVRAQCMEHSRTIRNSLPKILVVLSRCVVFSVNFRAHFY